MDTQQTEAPMELVGGAIRSFDETVRERFRDCCGNCGGAHKLRVKLIVPFEAGGQEIESNAILICRACELSQETAARLPGSEGRRRLINFWVSRQLHDRMINGMKTSRGLNSLSSLIRFLLTKFVEDGDRFDDLSNFQDSGANDVKVNVWVSTDQYDLFKQRVNAQGLTVTDAIRSLILMFDDSIVTK